MRRGGRVSNGKKTEQAASAWKDRELLDGRTVDTGVIILRTSGCSHYHKGGCSMCGYNYESDKSVTPENIMRQFEHAMEDLGEIEFLKVYTSGSFLDECEIPDDVAGSILKACAEKDIRLLFESRPEYVTAGRLDSFLAVHDNLEIALGLESSNDNVLRYSINKGFTAADYECAADAIAKKGIDLRTYVLLKPPFLTEAEAIADSVATVKFASTHSKTVSLNPVNVQKGTLVERLWRNWAYRPPWLWSVLEVLKASKGSSTRIICDPTGGGNERGAHNCGKCDDVILSSIKSFSLSQDHSRLGYPDCDCKEIWKTVIELDGLVMGGTPDLQRFFRRHGA